MPTFHLLYILGPLRTTRPLAAMVEIYTVGWEVWRERLGSQISVKGHSPHPPPVGVGGGGGSANSLQSQFKVSAVHSC